MSLFPYLDSRPQLGERTYIDPSARLIGSVQLGADSSVWCNAVLRGDVHDIVIGTCSNIQDFTMGHVSHRSPSRPAGSPLIVGDYVTVGHGVTLHGCRIGNECLVGMGSIVMDDVIVEDHVMIGAGSLVPPNKTLKSGYLYVGRPVQQVRPLTDAEIAYLRYSAEHYVRVKDNYLKAAASPSEQ